jgi:hypothetical protein
MQREKNQSSGQAIPGDGKGQGLLACSEGRAIAPGQHSRHNALPVRQ